VLRTAGVAVEIKNFKKKKKKKKKKNKKKKKKKVISSSLPESKAFNYEEKKSFVTFQEKSDLHMDIDKPWKIGIFSNEDRDRFRSLEYQIYAAVIHDQDKKFTSKGIFEPREGMHHIKTLPRDYHESFKKCIRYILYNKCKGNINKMSSLLM